MDMLWTRETTLTVDTNSKEGEYFIEKIMPLVKHVMSSRPNKELGKGWHDYAMHDEDYQMCREELGKFRKGLSM